jgi:hypothetical protein
MINMDLNENVKKKQRYNQMRCKKKIHSTRDTHGFLGENRAKELESIARTEEVTSVYW